jgi:hypothetical protein
MTTILEEENTFNQHVSHNIISDSIETTDRNIMGSVHRDMIIHINRLQNTIINMSSSTHYYKYLTINDLTFTTFDDGDKARVVVVL